MFVISDPRDHLGRVATGRRPPPNQPLGSAPRSWTCRSAMHWRVAKPRSIRPPTRSAG